MISSSDATAELNRLLSNLNESLTGSSNVVDSSATANDLKLTILDQSESSLVLLEPLLLSTKDGVLGFLRSSRGSKAHNPAKEILCDFLTVYLRTHGSKDRLEPFAKDIVVTCMALFNADKGARVTAGCLELLSQLLSFEYDDSLLALSTVFKKLFDAFITQSTKLSASVKAALLRVLGTICHLYHGIPASLQVTQLKRVSMQILKQQLFQGSSPDNQLTSGCIDFFTALLYNDISTSEIQEVYQCIRQPILMSQDMTRYDLPKAALYAVSEHASKFIDAILNDTGYQEMLQKLNLWACHHNRDVSKIGISSFEHILIGIAVKLKGDRNEKYKPYCNFILNLLKDRLDTSSSSFSIRETSTAVRCFSSFAPAVSLYWSHEQVIKLRNHIFLQMNNLYGDHRMSTPESVGHLSSFLTAFSHLIEGSLDVDSALIKSLEILLSRFLEYAPAMEEYQRYDAAKACRKVFITLVETDFSFAEFWSTFCYKALIFSCSEIQLSEQSNEVADEDEPNHSEQFGPDFSTGGIKEPKCWKAFFPFWKMIVAGKLKPDERLQNNLVRTCFDGFMAAVSALPYNLNFVTRAGNDGDNGNALTGSTILVNPETLVPEKPKDFNLFANFVEFIESIIPLSDPTLVLNALPLVIEQCISFSRKYPFVSGFYRILTAFLKVSLKHDWFAVDNAGDEKIHTRNILTEFLHNVPVQIVKDELLSACLICILSAPEHLVASDVQIVTVVKALEMGTSYKLLAVETLDALERWEKSDHLTKFSGQEVKKLIESLTQYFKDTNKDDAVTSSEPDQTQLLPKKTSRYSIKRLKKKEMSPQSVSQVELISTAEIQLRIAKVLAELLYLTEPDNEIRTEGLISWSKEFEPLLPLSIPFSDHEISIYIDDLLPKICELAESSTVRVTKVAASECLHAVFLLILGRVAFGDASQSRLQNILERTIPVLFRLAVDFDVTVRDLFRPLVLQTIHWVTRSSRSESAETMIVLNSCLAAACDKDGPLRDFGVETTVEFFVYSVNQNQAVSSSVHVKSLLKRLYTLLLHRDALHRSGAALVIMALHHMFRSNDALVREYVFEILYNLLSSYRISLRSADSQTPPILTQALNQTTRIIQKYFKSLHVAESRRRPFGTISNPTISLVSDWLVSQLGSGISDFVCICLDILVTIVENVSDWLMTKDSNWVNHVICVKANREQEPEKWLRQCDSSFTVMTKIIDSGLLAQTQLSHLLSATGDLASKLAVLVKTFTSLDITASLVNESLNSLFLLLVTESTAKSLARVARDLGVLVSYAIFYVPSEIGETMLLSHKYADSVSRSVLLLGSSFDGQQLTSFSDGLRGFLDPAFFLDNAFSTIQDKIKMSKWIPGLNCLSEARLVRHVLGGQYSDIITQFSTLLDLFESNDDVLVLNSLKQIVKLFLLLPEDNVKLCREFLGFAANELPSQVQMVFNKSGNVVYSTVITNFDAMKQLVESAQGSGAVKYLITETLDYISRNRSIYEKMMPHFFNQLSSCASMTRNWLNDADHEFSRRVFTGLCTIGASSNSDLCNVLCDHFCQKTSQMTTSSQMKEMIEFLPYFLGYDESRDQLIANNLGSFIANSFASSPSQMEKIKSSSEDVYATYMSTIGIILKALQLKPAVAVAKVLFLHIFRDATTIFESQFSQLFTFIVSSTSEQLFRKWLDMPWRGFLETDYNPFPLIRRNFVIKCLVPLLSAKNDTSRMFLVQQIQKIMEIIQEPAPPTKDDLIVHLNVKGCAFALLALIYQVYPLDDVHSPTGVFVTAFCATPKDGRELSVKLIKTANENLSAQFTDLTDNEDLIVWYRRQVYMALAACIALTQSKITVYQGFLFKDKLGGLLAETFDNVHDPFEKKEKIKEQVRELEKFWIGSQSTQKSPQKLQFLTSVYLSDSSLSLGPSLSFSGDYNITSAVTGSNNSITATDIFGTFKLIFTKIDDIIKEQNVAVNMKTLPFLAEIEKALAPDVKLPLRLFTLQVILGSGSSLFKLVGSELWMRLAQLLLEEDLYAIKSFHLIDSLVDVMLEWANSDAENKATDNSSWEAKQVASDLIRILLEKVDLSSKGMIMRQIGLIQRVIQGLSSLIEPPTDLINSWFDRKGDVKMRSDSIQDDVQLKKMARLRNLLAIYATSTFIGNGISPYNEYGNVAVTEGEFYTGLVGMITSEHREIAMAAAECSGQVLTFVQRKEIFALVEKRVKDELQRLSLSSNEKGSQVEKFVLSLNLVSKGYALMVEHFYQRIIYHLTTLHGRLQAKALETLASAGDKLPNLLQELFAKDLIGMLNHRDEEIQLWCLVLLVELIPQIAVQDWNRLYPILQPFYRSHSTSCRRAYYSFLGTITTKASNLVSEIGTVKQMLLNGLQDDDDGIREMVYEFFSQHISSPDTLTQCGLILRQIYSEKLEEQFFSHSIQLLFKNLSNSSGFTRQIFPSGLADATFKERRINTSWIANTAMQPLFASQGSATQIDTFMNGSFDSGIQRTAAPGTIVWTPTLDLDAVSTRNLFSESGVSIGASGMAVKRSRLTPAGQTNPEQLRLSQRRTAEYFAKQANIKKRKVAESRLLQKIARNRIVQLTRTYHDGEIPNVQISAKDILNPLLETVKHDEGLSCMFFVKLMNRLHGEIRDARDELTEQFIQLLDQCHGRSPLFIRGLLSVLLNMDIKNRVSPRRIIELSSKSTNQLMGIRLLEAFFETKAEKPSNEPSRKRKAAEVDNTIHDTSSWSALAELYEQIGYNSIGRSVLEFRASMSAATTAALSLQDEGQYAESLKLFSEITAGTADEKTLISREQWHCLSQLGMWSQVRDESRRNQQILLQFPESEDYSSRLLLNANFHVLDAEAVATLKEVQKYAMNERIDLQDKLSYELAKISVLAGSFEQGEVFATKSLAKLIDEFSKASPVAFSRNKIMNSFLGACEILKVSNMGKWKKGENNKQFRSFISQSPSHSIDIAVWNDLQSNRKLLHNAIEVDNQEFATDYSKFIINMSRAARQQRNLDLAQSLLEGLIQSVSFTPETVLYFLEAMRLNFAIFTSSFVPRTTSVKAFESGVKYHNMFKNELEALPINIQDEFKLLRGSFYSKGGLELASSEQSELGSHLLEHLSAKGQAVSPLTLSKTLIQSSFKMFKEILQNQPQSIETHLALLRHCDGVLRSSGECKLQLNEQEYVMNYLDSSLFVMAADTKRTASYFPRVIQLLLKYQIPNDELSDMILAIPSWKFIPIISQITSTLDLAIGQLLFPLLSKISGEYPGAVRSPFAISKEQYNLDVDGSVTKEQLALIEQKLVSPVHAQLLQNLYTLVEPMHLLKDFIEKLDLMADRGDAVVPSVKSELVPYCVDGRIGQGSKKFAGRHGKPLAKLLDNIGKPKSNLVSITKDLQKYYQEKVNGKEALPKGKMPLEYYSTFLSLYQYMPTMDDASQALEIPGQYTSTSMDRLIQRSFLHISGFKQTVLVLSSLRRPKKLDIIGDDGREYAFLVKGGEDLRLDQRVEQTFSVMNDVYRADFDCKRSQIKLQTYEVTPLTSNLGLLEWIPNVRPLRQCMADVKGFEDDMAHAERANDQFLAKHSGKNSGIVDRYANVLKKGSPQDCASIMNTLWNTMQKSYLTEFLLNLSISPEAFIILRNHLTRTHASLSISSYILGIGDRHSDNFLIALDSATMVGIDFGHAFGSATEILPVPEFMPFRLTKQIEILCQPLGVEVLLSQPMKVALSALRQNVDEFMVQMDIFVNEPLMDWSKLAKRVAKNLELSVKASESAPSSGSRKTPSRGKKSLSADMDDVETIPYPDMSASLSSFQNKSGEKLSFQELVTRWYPEQKLNQVRAKLSGVHPSYVMLNDFTWGHSQKDFYTAAKEKLLGVKQGHPRAAAKYLQRKETVAGQAGMPIVSVQDQIDILMDQAMDPCLLAATWRGWGAWC